MDWTKNFGRKPVGQKQGARFKRNDIQPLNNATYNRQTKNKIWSFYLVIFNELTLGSKV